MKPRGKAFDSIRVLSRAALAVALSVTAWSEAHAAAPPDTTDPASDAPAPDAPSGETPSPDAEPGDAPEPGAEPTSSKAPESTLDAPAQPADSAASSKPLTDEEEAASADSPKDESASAEPKASAKKANKEEEVDPKKSVSHHKLGSIAVSAGWGFNMIVPYDDDAFCGEFSNDGDGQGRKGLCTKANPVFIEFMGGYGVAKRVDVTVTVRLNLQKRDFRCRDDGDPDTCKGLFVDKLGFGFFPGVRLWISKPEKLAKVGAALDLYYMYENFDGYRSRQACEGPNDQVGGPCFFPEEDPANPRDPMDPNDPVARKSAVEQDIGDNDVGLRLGPVIQIDPHHNVGLFLLPAARLSFVRWLEVAFAIQLGVQARFP